MSKSTGNRIKFISNRDGGWMGNGFGNVPNTYRVEVNGKEFGLICYNTGWDKWCFSRLESHTIDGVKFKYERTPSCKAEHFGVLKAEVRCMINAV